MPIRGKPIRGKLRQLNLRMRLSRAELFASLSIIGCANGLAGKVIKSANLRGWTNAAFGTFDISAIVVISCVCGIGLMLRSKEVDEVRSTDVAVCAVLLLLIALPVAAMAWLAVTGLSLYRLLFTKVDDSARRGAIILLATTVPMLWSRMLFDFLANPILRVDATLVSWVLGTHRTGNMVEFADRSGTLVIFEGCSSLANMSLALLCWVTVSQFSRHKPRPTDFFWCLLACASVVTVNVLRMSLMGLSVSHYDAIHDALGDFIVNSALLGLTVGISLWGVRGDVIVRR
jgi:exosortase/archaeosortase family protein